jgi:hypothetical protein
MDRVMGTNPTGVISNDLNLNLRAVAVEAGEQARFALHLGDSVICRAPALKKGKGLATTNPGHVVYVLSEGSSLLKPTARDPRPRWLAEVASGKLFLLPCEGDEQLAKADKSVRTLESYASRAQLAKAKRNRKTLTQALADAKASKVKAKAPAAPAVLADAEATIAELKARIAELQAGNQTGKD